VDDRRYALGPPRPDVVREEHERRRQRPRLEDLRRALGEHHRRHRPELLAALDVVEPLEVGRLARVGEQRAVPERPRPELRAALEPGDDLVAGQRLGDGVGHVGGPLVGDGGGAQPALERRVVPAAAQRGGRHGRHLVAEPGRDVHGRPQCRAGIPRGRLHPDLVVRPLPPQPRVGHAVERHAARHRQRAIAGAGLEVAGQLEQDLLQPPLDAGREIGMGGQEVAAGGERRREGVEVHRRHAEAAAVGPHQLLQRIEMRRPAVRGHRHDLVLVGRPAEAEVGGQLLVQQPQRVRQLLDGQDLEPAVLEAAREVRGALAATVQHEHVARVQAGRERGRRRVRDVMRYPAHALGVEARQARAQEERRPARVERAQPLPVGGGDVTVERRGQVGVVGVRDRVEVGGLDAGLAQAERHCLLGQLPGRERDRRLAVLAAREALLLRGGDGDAVHDQRSRRIVEDRVDTKYIRHREAALREALLLKRRWSHK
jgi:hypothetical protein